MVPYLSIVIAVRNGEKFLPECLAAASDAADTETEIILVDDDSTDNSAGIGRRFGAKVISLKRCAGAGNARNIGAGEAVGEIILFVDADVVIQSDAIHQIRTVFNENPEVTAIFGSYDDAPGEPDFFSQYRNLMHHFYHQTGSREAETFWSGFGAIKRKTFLEVKGFDVEKFKIPSVEDIELGYRLRQKGHRILLIPELQAKHLKKWTFYSILKTDFWQRAVPWVEIILLNPQVKPDLNAKVSQKVSALLAGIFLFAMALAFWRWWMLLVGIGAISGLIFINRDFYAFLWKRKGFIFAMRAFPMHLLYFLYSSTAFIYSWLNVRLLRRTIVVR